MDSAIKRMEKIHFSRMLLRFIPSSRASSCITAILASSIKYTTIFMMIFRADNISTLLWILYELRPWRFIRLWTDTSQGNRKYMFLRESVNERQRRRRKERFFFTKNTPSYSSYSYSFLHHYYGNLQ